MLIATLEITSSTRYGMFAVLGIYVICLIFTSILFQRMNSSIHDYFRSGCKSTWWLAGINIFMHLFSAWTFTGAAGLAYEAGLPVVVIYISASLCFFVNFLFTAAWFRQFRAITPAEVIEMRFGRSAHQFYTWYSLLSNLIIPAIQLYGVAIFFHAVFGYSIKTTIIIMAAIGMIYSTIGGMWGIMANSMLQMLILMPMAILVAYLSLDKIGGIAELVKGYKNTGLSGNLYLFTFKYSWIWALAYFIRTLTLYNSIPSSANFFVVKDGTDARKAALLASALFALGAAIWFIPPMVARILFPDLESIYPSLQKPAEVAYAAVAFTLLPTALVGVMVAGILSTSLGTFSVGLNQTAAIFTRDVYKTLFRANASPKELFVVGQISTFAKGAICMTIAIIFANVQGQGVFEIMLTTMALIGTPLTIPLVMCLFIKKLPHWSMLFSILVGSICSLIAFLQKWSFEASVFGITAVTASAVLLTLVPAKLGLIKLNDSYTNQVNEFFKRMKTPVDFRKEIGSGEDYSQFRMLAMVLFIFGSFILSLSFFTKALWEIKCVLFAGGCILFTASLFQWIYSKHKKNFAAKKQPFTTKSPNILFCMPAGFKRDMLWSAEARKRAEQLNYTIRLNPHFDDLTSSQLTEMLQDVDALITSWGCPKIDADALSKSNSLKIIGHAAGSVAEYVTPEVFERGIKVVSANYEMSRSVAEWCLMMTMVGQRRLLDYSQLGQYRNIDWANRYRIRGFQDAVIGIWGYGDVVRHLLPMLKTLCPKEILIHSDFLTKEEASAHHVRKVEFNEIFAKADVIHVLEGLTPSSRERIASPQLALIRDGAVLCNCGRADLIQYDSLIRELQKERFTAILDVHYIEPLLDGTPFHGLSNVILTPHNAGYGRHELYVKYVLDQFDKFFKGEPLENEITAERAKAMTHESIFISSKNFKKLGN